MTTGSFCFLLHFFWILCRQINRREQFLLPIWRLPEMDQAVIQLNFKTFRRGLYRSVTYLAPQFCAGVCAGAANLDPENVPRDIRADIFLLAITGPMIVTHHVIAAIMVVKLHHGGTGLLGIEL